MMQHGFKTLISLFVLAALAGCSSITPFSKKGKLQTIAFYNTGNLYDIQNNPTTTNDDDFLPTGAMQWDQARYQAKLNALAAAIQHMGGKGGPAVIGLSEVENRQVLEALLNMPALRKHDYEYILHESAKEPGLDVALLYKPNIFKLSSQRSIPVNVNERNFTARDILEVKGTLLGEPVTIFVNHWPSGRDSRKRAAANLLRNQIAALQQADPTANIIVMGDFDEVPGSTIMRQALKATGRPNPAYNEELFNTFYIQHVQGNGSYFGRNGFMMLDQILVSKSLVDAAGHLQYVRGSATIHSPASLKSLYGKYRNTPRPTYSGTTYFGGTSDHFPVYIKVQKVK
ncbi:endonuclease/exonuclease/phosphatase family protein [Botryobacter ruber]|uniref:endonuclease/exonuclease/phosphatase family protein n=1 Tax=Botryobacter ruber TaxID=2171629 RepID=UPI000F655D30|nr:endonuclease/exonuclease/phosphatase family protein [Botryobacter ruber]